MIDIRQSQRYAKYLESVGWTVERIAEINYFIKVFPIIGSVIKVQRPEEIRIDTIRELARKYRAFEIIVEPKTKMDADFLASIGFKLSKEPYLPSKTLQIDLTKSRDEIFRHFKKDARQAVKRGEAINVNEYSTPSDLKIFREAWKNSVNFQRYVPPLEHLIKLRKSFPDKNSLFLASHNISGSIIGGVIFTRSLHDIAYYWQAFTNSEGAFEMGKTEPAFIGEAGIIYSFEIKNFTAVLFSP